MKKLLALMISFLLIICFILAFLPKSSYACSCIQPGTVQEELKKSKVVFRGEVLEITENEKDYEKEILFKVTSLFKGTSDSQILLSTGINSAACGFHFVVGKEYLVYASGDNQLQTTICSRTTEIDNANEDLEELKSIEIPEKKADAGNKNNQFPLNIVLVVVGLGVMGAVIFTKRR